MDTISCFSEVEISRFPILNIENNRYLERKVHFFDSHETTKISRTLILSVYIRFYFKYLGNYKIS